jgi:transcriptional regulator with XRE-family HTH domain
MGTQRKRITPIGEVLREARQAVGFDQLALAGRMSVSQRTVSRWENGGQRPSAEQSEGLVEALMGAPDDVVERLARMLGVELEDDENDVAPAALPPAPAPPVAVVVAAPPPPPAPLPAPAPPRPSATELRSSLDAVVLAGAEEHDVLPRKLRAFGVALLQRIAELGLDPNEAALHLSPRRPKPE